MADEIELTPEPGILIESLRDIGYSFESALADIIDNSITANASEINIMALPVDDSFRVSILDNGEGLDRNALLRAMRLGSSNPRDERANDDLGRFGLGLKTASFSQCRRLTVVSRQHGETSAFTWDLDTVVRENSWSVLERTDYDEIFGYDTMPDTGTLVLWEKVDRLTGDNGSGRVDYDRVISEAQDHLSLVFHRFLAKEKGTKSLRISFNAHDLEPLDPFNMSNDATQASPEEVVCPGVTLRSFTLPHISTYSDRNEYERYGLRGGYLRNQGVYLYRAKRLIIFGTWFGLAKKTALTQLTRVKIDIGTNQDETWKIDVKKVSAQMPEIVRKRVRALIQTIGAPSRKVYSRRGARLTSPDVYPVWTRSENGEKTTYGINMDHPLVRTFGDELDGSLRKRFDSLMAFIGAMLPTEALFYDISNNADAVESQHMSNDDFAMNVRMFYAALTQFKDEEEALDSMRSIEPYRSRWDETLSALGIEES
ncbi:ATP-binding protein [Bifidobacterium avesanii]|uniref:ATP-binding protein n=1 Tax=Bifidobacterium avesanii TaxID=1798157 RepID=A0A7K3TL17_9BIFI|nr:ATP-binding protein [Bifidobacterium avesanii]KAB8287258.1 DNA mismatch protein [Bifidobacterium avesanii]NEG79354.1 ATP-binding protein [Bifidobacterium avesanii]